MSITTIVRILKFTALNAVVTFMAGWFLRLVLPLLGTPFVDYLHLWGSLLFALPSWAATLWVFWLLARRHPEGYWYAASAVAVLSVLVGLALGYLMNPEAMKLFTLKGLMPSLFWQSVVIVVAAILSRRVKYFGISGGQEPEQEKNLTNRSMHDRV